MALRINTNVAALNAHKNMIKTDNGLSSALEKLSSGLRINKAADDASGMAIADALRSQYKGLGQAIRNGNDAINIVQTADAALEESINIVNTIKTKSIQAAQDGQTLESRKAIQADVSKLTEELDTIANTTSFNGQKLLSGNFNDKRFQIGAYAGETVGVSIQSTESTKIGHVNTAEFIYGTDSSLSNGGTTTLSITSSIDNETYTLHEITLADNTTITSGTMITSENGIGVVADAINKLSDKLGISAEAVVSSNLGTAGNAVTAGLTNSDFAINGVLIGAVQVQDNDADGSLVSAINSKTNEHGVVASVGHDGKLTLTSTDHRAIDLEGGSSGTTTSSTGVILGEAVGASGGFDTLGKLVLRQQGASQISISDDGGNGKISTAGGQVIYNLADIDVTSQEDAQNGIAVADAALKNLDKVRSDLGSVQNQLTSTIANISTTRVNVGAAESTIRDVDFAEESANFTKMQILSQSGTFAMSQANASSQNVMSLLQ